MFSLSISGHFDQVPRVSSYGGSTVLSTDYYDIMLIIAIRKFTRTYKCTVSIWKGSKLGWLFSPRKSLSVEYCPNPDQKCVGHTSKPALASVPQSRSWQAIKCSLIRACVSCIENSHAEFMIPTSWVYCSQKHIHWMAAGASQFSSLLLQYVYGTLCTLYNTSFVGGGREKQYHLHVFTDVRRGVRHCRTAVEVLMVIRWCNAFFQAFHTISLG